MLNLLRADIARENANTSFADLLSESLNSMEIRQLFVDEDEVDEKDPELARLIDEIPESSEDDDEVESIDELIESFIPGTEVF